MRPKNIRLRAAAVKQSPKRRRRLILPLLQGEGLHFVESGTHGLIELRSSARLNCRSLFDALQKITPTLDEKRTAIDVAAIKEVVGKKNIRWCPSAFQWGDGFTKLDPALMAKLTLFLYDPEITLVAEDES